MNVTYQGHLYLRKKNKFLFLGRFFLDILNNLKKFYSFKNGKR